MTAANPAWRTRLLHGWHRLDRRLRFAATVAAIAGAACLTVFVALVTPLVWRPAPSGGYESIMLWSLDLGLGALAVAAVAAAVRWIVPITALGLRWIVQHPFRAAIWAIGLPLIAVALFVLAGVGGLAGLVIVLAIAAEIAHRKRRHGAQGGLGDHRIISNPPTR